MKVVLDTNIYLSGLAFPKSFPGKVLELARARKFEVFCSKFILGEIKKNFRGIKIVSAKDFISRYFKNGA